MRKNLLKIALAMVVVATGSYGSYKAYNKCIHQDSDLFLMNIEALTQPESINISTCYSKSSDTDLSKQKSVYECNSYTTSGTIYSCPSNETYIVPGTSSSCISN